LESVKLRWAILLLGRLVRSDQLVLFNSSLSEREHRQVWSRAFISRIVPNGFDLDAWSGSEPADFHSGNQAPWRQGDAFVFGHVARVHPMKNHVGLLRAFDRVATECPQSRLVLVGRGTEKLDTSTLVNADRIHLLGERLDVPSLMRTFDAFVLCSTFGEGFPNVVAEAILSGLPALVTDVGDAALISGNANWALPPGDQTALEQAMLSLYKQDAGERESDVLHAQARVQKEFGIQAIIERYDRVWSASLDEQAA
jgi:glycosyltransferase involved in cell wall biosynthesis